MGFQASKKACFLCSAKVKRRAVEMLPVQGIELRPPSQRPNQSIDAAPFAERPPQALATRQEPNPDGCVVECFNDLRGEEVRRSASQLT